MSVNSYNKAKTLFLSGDFSFAEKIFEEENCVLENAYCRFLTGDLEVAKKMFHSISDEDLRADWAEKLIQFIECKPTIIPSYFQIRNFLEIDLNLLIQAKKPDYVENILGYADLFYSVNPESYKFIARVMLNNDFVDLAFHFLNKAKDKFYYDPELHLMLANCHIQRKEILLARRSIRVCLDILPDYFPAKKLLEVIEKS